jgi:hypothetical protein
MADPVRSNPRAMMPHLLGIGAAVGVLVSCALLPFFPGRYDVLATPLSSMARVLGIVGLLLVPVGALWALTVRWRWLAPRRRALSILTAVAASLVWLLVALFAFTLGWFSLGVVVLVAWVLALRKAVARLRAPGAAMLPAGAMAGWCLFAPVVAACLQHALVGPLLEASRSRVIGNSAPLIQDIEGYRATRGSYPPSLLSVWNDYLPGVLGVREYRYEPSGDSYNLCFEHPALALDSREFVVYNPRDQQQFTSHDSDLLRRTPDELAHRRGHRGAVDASHAHWKIFRFD